MPRRARTVSLLESFALRSPTSSVPSIGVAKCRVMVAFEPPAAMPHRARNDALRQSAAARRPGTRNGREGEVNKGERVSRMIAASLRTSANRRYDLASGASDDPKA